MSSNVTQKSEYPKLSRGQQMVESHRPMASSDGMNCKGYGRKWSLFDNEVLHRLLPKGKQENHEQP
jgi:hypothetical protein